MPWCRRYDALQAKQRRLLPFFLRLYFLGLLIHRQKRIGLAQNQTSFVGKTPQTQYRQAKISKKSVCLVPLLACGLGPERLLRYKRNSLPFCRFATSQGKAFYIVLRLLCCENYMQAQNCGFSKSFALSLSLPL